MRSQEEEAVELRRACYQFGIGFAQRPAIRMEQPADFFKRFHGFVRFAVAQVFCEDK